MVLADMLSEQDLDKISTYMREWGSGCAMPADKYLTEYVRYPECKKDLFHLLGNQVIYKIPNFKIEKDGIAFLKELEGFYDRNYSTINFFEKLVGELSGVYNIWRHRLIPRSYQEETTETYTYEGKTLRLNDGLSYTKTVSAIIKFLKNTGRENAANIIKTEFEPIRNKLSQITQDKTLSGTLCLSIHPLDYFTMSDNGYGWRSCMSWDDGDYHAGTLEMLSSDYVVVAYLEGKEEWYPCSNKAMTWSNKKWRELFIVHEDFITSVKGYPYRNDELTTAVLNTLKTLAAKNLGWEYGENETQFGAMRSTSMTTDLMYNDYYNEHLFAIGTKVEELPRFFNYSGTAYCIECGAPIEDGLENSVCCSSCLGMVHCAGCGAWVTEDDYYTHWVDDNLYCEDCYNELPACSICGKVEGRLQDGIVIVSSEPDAYVWVSYCDSCAEYHGIEKDSEKKVKFYSDPVIYPTKNIEEFMEVL